MPHALGQGSLARGGCNDGVRVFIYRPAAEFKHYFWPPGSACEEVKPPRSPSVLPQMSRMGADDWRLDPERAAEGSGGVVGLGAVVVDEDVAVAEIAEERAAEFSDV